MREITTKVYSFDELSKEAKKKAIAYISDREAENWGYFGDYLECEAIEHGFAIAMKGKTGERYVHNMEEYGKAIRDGFRSDFIDTFDLYRNEIALNAFHIETEDKRISLIDGGKEFTDEYDVVVEAWEKKLYSLGQDTLKELQKDYEYACSEEYAIESINGNEYEFYEDGTII